MKTIGLIGGVSWYSTLEYYRYINLAINKSLGGVHSAKCILHSVDFADIFVLVEQGHWDLVEQEIIEAARGLKAAGVDCIVICSNTMGRVRAPVQDALKLPVIDIIGATAAAIKKQSLNCVGLLGTSFTMNTPFYTEQLKKYGITEVTLPTTEERLTVHQIITQELTRGVISEQSRQSYKEVIAALVQKGAEGIILGCTEIELLIQDSHSPVPVFPTTQIHAQAAVNYALNG